MQHSLHQPVGRLLKVAIRHSAEQQREEQQAPYGDVGREREVQVALCLDIEAEEHVVDEVEAKADLATPHQERMGEELRQPAPLVGKDVDDQGHGQPVVTRVAIYLGHMLRQEVEEREEEHRQQLVASGSAGLDIGLAGVDSVDQHAEQEVGKAGDGVDIPEVSSPSLGGDIHACHD